MKNTFLVLVLLFFITACEEPSTVERTEDDITTRTEWPLQDTLAEMVRRFENTAVSEKQEAYNKGIQQIEESGILKKAKQKGDKAPNFTLTDATGKKVSLYEELKKGPVVLTWYRGGWCPYCNIQLRYLQDKLPEIGQEGAQVLALTPEKPDSTLSTSEKLALEFQVLSDLNNEIARKYGLVFKLDEDVSRLYKESFSLQQYNDNDSDELPLAATYIIDTDGTIVYAYLNADYRKRAEPAEIIAELKKIDI